MKLFPTAQAITLPCRQLGSARGLPLPQNATAASAGFDLAAALDHPQVLAPGERALIPTGIAIAIPPGYEGQIRPRSGLAVKNGIGILNSPGTIDSDYRGEIKVLLINHGQEPFTITRGDRIAQLVIVALPEVRIVPVAELTASQRGTQGFGSSGVAAPITATPQPATASPEPSTTAFDHDGSLSDAALERYARQIVLENFGEDGQARLLQARVLVVGAGGLGAPLITYLAAAGIGHIGVIDPQTSTLSDLQRQFIHGQETLGAPKVQTAIAFARRINPEITYRAYPQSLSQQNAAEIIADYDIIADGSDNFPTRLLVNDHCQILRKTLVSAALAAFEAQVTCLKPHAHPSYPCYRCIFGAPEDHPHRSCAEVGILGAFAGMVGSLQAMEVIKEILGHKSLAGTLLLVDGITLGWKKITTQRNPNCENCINLSG